VDTLNSVYSSVDGVLFNKSQTTVIQYPGAKTGSYTVPKGVTSIAGDAFSFCNGLTSVSIPNSVTSIGGGTFYRCESLTNVNIPDSVTSIGSHAFYACRKLTSIRIPDGVTAIGNATFYYCSGLTNITIPNSVTTIGQIAFWGCTSLTNVTIPNSVTNVGTHAFLSCSSLIGVYFGDNAPSLGASVFSGANNTTVYYLPGTTGWGPTFGGRPTALWVLPNPLILDRSVGVQTNVFGFIISWATNVAVVVEACPNLANPAWSPVTTNTLTTGIDPLTDGWSYFSDLQWTNHPARFYRLRSP